MSFRRREMLLLAGSGVLSGCGSSASFLACPASPPAGTWNNAVTSFDPLGPELLAYPSSTAIVVELVKAAEARRQRVRMTGSGHSFSDVALNDGMLLLPDRLASPLSLDRARLKTTPAADRHLVRVQGGMTIRSLNNWLDPQCLALSNLGGYDAQTITGVAMTATHGSGRMFGPLVTQIASLQLVTSGGEVRQIEPSDGITDPAKFPGFLEEDRSIPVKLVQNDDEFNAVSVSMGSMGIVTAVVLKTVDNFWLREERSFHVWSEVAKPGGYLQNLITRPPLGSGFPDHVEIYINPYENPRGDHYCVVTQRYRLATEPKQTPQSKGRGLLGDGALFSDSRLRKLTEAGLRKTLDNADLKELETIHTLFLAATVDPNYTAESYKVFNLGEVNRLRAQGIEMAFKITDAIQATEAVFEHAKQEYAEGRHHSVPFSLRFVKGASPYLAMQQREDGYDTVELEMGVLVAAKGSKQLLANYEQLFIDKFKARPHWGLDMSVLKSWSQVEALYGKQAADSWRKVYERLNLNGTFNGRFTDRLGISVPPKPLD